MTKHIQWLVLLLAINHNILYTAKPAKNIEQTFTSIYQNATWGTNEEGIGHSGGGSTLHNTHAYIAFLEEFIRSNNITSVVDFGCGDWEFSQHIDWQNTLYTGYDIVKSVIERNIKKFASPSRVFIHANGLHENLIAADLLICKDVLQHLSNKNILKFLKQTHKFKYCLITNDIHSSPDDKNSDITDGEHRTLDLSKEPFNVKGDYIFPFVPTDGHAKKPLFLITNHDRALFSRCHRVVSDRLFDTEQPQSQDHTAQ